MAIDPWDIMRQGFMKPRKERRTPKPPPEIVACDDCLNWHLKGKHTADAATRKANREKAKAKAVAPGQHLGGAPSSKMVDAAARIIQQRIGTATDDDEIDALVDEARDEWEAFNIFAFEAALVKLNLVEPDQIEGFGHAATWMKTPGGH